MANSKRPKVGIVILNYNGWLDTRDCLSAIDRLTYGNFETYVVDNASTNDSVEQLRSNARRAQVIESAENLGFGRGNNLGICHAMKGGADFVWLLNNDTKVDPNSLTALVERMEQDAQIGAVGSVLYWMDEPARVQVWGGCSVNWVLGRTGVFTRPVAESRIDYLCGASMLIRRDVLEQVGMFDDGFFMYWEDADLGVRIRRAGWKLAVAPGARILHKQWGSSSRAAAQRMYQESASLFFRRNARLPQVPLAVRQLGRVVKAAVARIVPASAPAPAAGGK